MAIIQHFDTKGNPLNGIDGFTDKEMKLEKGKDYTFPHTAPGEKYTYEGHKKSTREMPKVTGGSRTGGDPVGFKYDGTFPNY
ncbi:hypothetical protein HUB98_19245 [Paenibacillus barcinonensis]|uniref:Uncharacterized protein n=1 Tax=Paenibacillus barcinonensis TaxID=198119 RepID=A0A2V4VAP4_PAEBA|nr:hypothetical protein [Paenibacillus barcinonensis]PYE41870.1 hypothetical protein DFQ00_1482 [Paenibacillus barcinonensis]QKS58170.1 hypothetical protein HUB98_19245 [Paenibacillus barcinonensis]